jgi:hypothetical protein
MRLVVSLCDWLYLSLDASRAPPRRLIKAPSMGITIVGDIPNGYTSDVVLNQQARVAHQGWYGGFAIPGGPVAEVATAVLDAGAYGGSLDMSMADPEIGQWRTTDDKPMAGYLVVHA